MDDSSLGREIEVIKGLDKKVTEALSFLTDPEKLWYPSDFLPDVSREDWHDQIKEFRTRAKSVRLPILAVLIGNTLTEEALPAYMSWLNRIEHVKDKTGAETHPWAIWTRRWTAEEDRHGVLLAGYLALNPNVDLPAMQRSQYDLIAAGFDFHAGASPYNVLVYTSFQERATRISHQNTGIVAGKDGDTFLEKICLKIGGDEARHEVFYKTMMKHAFDADPNGAMFAFAKMMKEKIRMPAEALRGRNGTNLYDVFSQIAQAEGVYTARDYVEIMRELIKFWAIENRTGLTPEAQRAQEYLMSLPGKYERIAGRMEANRQPAPMEQVPWVRRAI